MKIFDNFVSKAFKNGIGTILIVPPDAEGTGLHTRPDTAARNAL
jgi:hypothetical protein